MISHHRHNTNKSPDTTSYSQASFKPLNYILSEPITFRVLPPGLSVGRLAPSFSILNEEERKRTKSITDTSPINRKYSKEELKSSFDQIKLKGRNYVIVGQPVVQGSWSETYYVQDVDDDNKPFYLLKSQWKTGSLKKEFSFLQKVNLAVDEVEEEPVVEDTRKQHLLLQLVPGISGRQLIEKNRRYSDARWVNIIVSMLIAIQTTLAKKVLHLDIKPDNFIIDEATDNATLVDFGVAHDDVSLETKEIYGTPIYLAPEIADCRSKNTYNEKTVMFAAGMTIAEMLGLLIIKNKKGCLTETDNNHITDAKLRLSILKFLHQMTMSHPDNRVSLKDAIEFFSHTQLTLVETIGIFDFSEFKNNEMAFLQALKKVDKAVVIDRTDQHDEEIYLTLKELFHNNDITLAKIFHEPGRSLTSLVVKIAAHIDRHDRGVKEYVFYTSADISHLAYFTKHHVTPMNIDREVSLPTIAGNHLMFFKHREIIQQELKAEHQRTSDKDRKTMLASSIRFLETASYEEAKNALRDNLAAIKHTNPFKEAIETLSPNLFSLKGRTNLAKIIQKLEEFEAINRKKT